MLFPGTGLSDWEPLPPWEKARIGEYVRGVRQAHDYQRKTARG